MAEGQEDRSREDLTEEASSFRLEDYRRRGIVSQSKELSALAAFVGAGITLWVTAPQMGEAMLDYMREVFRVDQTAKLDFVGPGQAQVVQSVLWRLVNVLTYIGLPITLVGFFAGAIASAMQFGGVFSTEPLTPDFERVNPLKGLSRYFSSRMWVEALRLVFKAALAVGVAYMLVKTEILKAPAYAFLEHGGILAAFGEAGRSVVMGLAAVLAVFAGVDFGMQKWEYRQNLRMTKKEAKQEFKEREGDPAIKARIRSVQREMARKRMMAAVRKADVVVTNPTHIAVAIVYDRDAMAAPKVVAKGADFVAQKIKKIASEAGVPLVENVPLARSLFRTVKVGGLVPRALYQAVAEVLAFVYRLRRNPNG